ncbi:hypothetical protein BaRGS_00007564 [Batillaria attramentaria]|uniref:Uncharacterized protein n=1 Tax=Batillaria attramentaria TaxID=370345 RepID=A0ABD0LN77_9CAEN
MKRDEQATRNARTLSPTMPLQTSKETVSRNHSLVTRGRQARKQDPLFSNAILATSAGISCLTADFTKAYTVAPLYCRPTSGHLVAVWWENWRVGHSQRRQVFTMSMAKENIAEARGIVGTHGAM